jgi:hypothetical protein
MKHTTTLVVLALISTCLANTPIGCYIQPGLGLDFAMASQGTQHSKATHLLPSISGNIGLTIQEILDISIYSEIGIVANDPNVYSIQFSNSKYYDFKNGLQLSSSFNRKLGAFSVGIALGYDIVKNADIVYSGLWGKILSTYDLPENVSIQLEIGTALLKKGIYTGNSDEMRGYADDTFGSKSSGIGQGPFPVYFGLKIGYRIFLLKQK